MKLFYRLSGWAGLLIYGGLIYEMARLWVAPSPDDIDRILTLAVMMAFEFVMVHSGVFMAVMPRKISLFVFVPFYAVFALCMNTVVPGNSILWLYFGVVFLRMRFAFSNPSRDLKTQAIAMSALAAITYFLLLIAFSVGSGLVPEFGLSDQFLESSSYIDNITVDGIFTEMPNVSMAMGIAYFTLIAIFESFIYGLFKFRASDLAD